MNRRRTTALAALFSSAVLLAACGDDEADTSASGSASTAAEGHGSDGHDDSASPASGSAREIDVVATDFEFDPSEITAEVGEEIAVALTSEDMLHDFTIDELDAHVSANRGDTETGGFTADEPGTYEYYCSVPGHRGAGMEGTLTVE